jgi:ribonucleoside-diphosphate reductase alpha chain
LSWKETIKKGELYGFRNAQVTLVAPTGTIGLLMDCDTTGIEPDFALVKYKRLAGGGHFKIINNSLIEALNNLGYKENEVNDIIKYVLGNQCLVPDEDKKGISIKKIIERAPTELLNDRVLLDNLIEYFKERAKSATTIEDIFGELSPYKCCSIMNRGRSPDKYSDITTYPCFDIIQQWGFTQEELDYTEKYICGTMTIEGAPHLKQRHYAVFDTASFCGKWGNRIIHWKAHIYMMEAIQPFISGAISKTINMPNTATYNDINRAYTLAYERGLKSITIYRDQSKLSQPLSSFGADMDILMRTIHDAKTSKKIPDNEVIEKVRLLIQEYFQRTKEGLNNNQRQSLPTKRKGLFREYGG